MFIGKPICQTVFYKASLEKDQTGSQSVIPRVINSDSIVTVEKIELPRRDGDIPPILLTHGDSDTVIPPQAMFLAAAQLGLAGAMVQWHLARGMGHGIDPEGLMMAGQFLSLAFGGLLKNRGEIRSVYKPSQRIG